MGGNCKPFRHVASVQSFGEQVQDIQLSRRELRNELRLFLLPGADAMLAANRAREELDRNENFASGCSTDSLNDLIGGCVLREVGRGAGVEPIKERSLGVIGAVEHDRR